MRNARINFTNLQNRNHYLQNENLALPNTNFPTVNDPDDYPPPILPGFHEHCFTIKYNSWKIKILR